MKKKSTKDPKSTQEEYKGAQTHSHLHPNQAKNPTKEIELSTLVTLAHPHKVNRKEDFILWAEGASFSKTTLFLSSHNVQNKQRGAAIQTLFLFFPTLALCQARKSCRTVRGKTQLASVIAKSKSHNILALAQWISKWSIVSSYSSHKKHLFAKGIPLYFS